MKKHGLALALTCMAALALAGCGTAKSTGHDSGSREHRNHGSLFFGCRNNKRHVFFCFRGNRF